MIKKTLPRWSVSVCCLLLTVLLCTCGPAQSEDEHGHDHAEEHAEGEEHHDDDHHEEGLHLTREQLATMDIGFGEFTSLKTSDFVAATGTLGLPPNAYSAVSAKASGFVKNARNYVEGSPVKRGAVLAVLENPDFIEHQRQYLEVKAEMGYLEQELERQEALLAADAGILKNVQRLRSEVAMKTATLKGLASRLEYLGIRTANLTPDNITQRITLFAPMSGYITSIAMHDGMYVEPQVELMEIVDEHQLHLELAVFERDVSQIKEGQRVSYTIPALGTGRYEAEVHVIGREFDTENKTVRVHADLTGDRPQFIKDLFVEAKIWLDDRTATALPEAAVVRDGELSYIFAGNPDLPEDEVSFERLRVNPGVTENGLTAVRLIDPLPEGMRVVTEGAYFVYAQGMVGEMGHDH